MNSLTWLYSRPQLEAARERVNEVHHLAELVTEFGLLALAYEELLSRWERAELIRERQESDEC